MARATDASFEMLVDQEANEIRVNNFVCSDPAVVQFFVDVPQEDQRSRFETALRIGAIAIRAIGIERDMDAIDKKIHEALDQWSQGVDDYLGKDGVMVNALLNPSDPNTPLGSLKRDLIAELVNLRLELSRKKGEKAIIQVTTRKGGEFENDLEPVVREIVGEKDDTVERTVNQEGLIRRCKQGDFVVTLNEMPDIRIVIEAKASDEMWSAAEVREEMKAAMQNRGACYGIFVARSLDGLQSDLGWFNECSPNILSIAVSPDAESDIDDRILRIGYKWARLRAIASGPPRAMAFDRKSVQDLLEKAKSRLNKFSNVKGYCSSIEKAATGIRDEMKEIESNLEKDLELIERQVSQAVESAK